jgi:hypothetical protein
MAVSMLCTQHLPFTLIQNLLKISPWPLKTNDFFPYVLSYVHNLTKDIMLKQVILVFLFLLLMQVDFLFEHFKVENRYTVLAFHLKLPINTLQFTMLVLFDHTSGWPCQCSVLHTFHLHWFKICCKSAMASQDKWFLSVCSILCS